MRFELDTDVLRRRVRDIPDYPQPGIVFKDITPLLADPVAFSRAIDMLVVRFGRGTIDKVVGIEARGFIVAAPVAYHSSAGFVPLRKAGKLPAATLTQDYELEYDVASLEVHEDAFEPGERVLIVDDVLATGGTARAACELVERSGASVVGLGFVIELAFLAGRAKIAEYDVCALVDYRE